MRLKPLLFTGTCLAAIVIATLSCKDNGTSPPPHSVPTPPGSYTVTYDGNGSTGGAVPVDKKNYITGEQVTVKPNSGKLVKSGLVFSFWSTKADGSGKSYAENDTFSMGSANVTLYAIWEIPHIYSVIYDGNGSTGGDVPVDTNKYRNGDRFTVKPNSGGLVKTGFVFSCWNNTTEGNGTDFPVDSQFSMGCTDLTLYAKWITP